MPRVEQQQLQADEGQDASAADAKTPARANGAGAGPQAGSPSGSGDDFDFNVQVVDDRGASELAELAASTSSGRPAAAGAGARADFIPMLRAAPAARAVPSAPAPGSADALADEQGVNSLGKRPYWMSYVSSISSPMLRLHQGELRRDWGWWWTGGGHSRGRCLGAWVGWGGWGWERAGEKDVQ